jgi:3-oxoacyl-[acyl-carrier protein] reductase
VISYHLAVHLRPYASQGVRINAIRPGFVVTPMTEAVLRNAGDSVLGRVPIRRYGQPEEIGQAAAWLLSNRASYVTGSIVAVDGGFTAQ